MWRLYRYKKKLFRENMYVASFCNKIWGVKTDLLISCKSDDLYLENFNER
jgi:hypothetical protein